MLTVLVASALLSFAGAVALPLLLVLAPAVHIHLAFAVGVMPLILGAMTHFVPVLTRSRAPAATILLLPGGASVAGLLAILSFALPALIPNLYYAGALLALCAAGGMAAWIVRRSRLALGAPHSCLHWYLAAVACLMLALAAVLAMGIWPEQRLALKRFHLHLNLLGFLGLTAIGTLQVLLPTAAGRPDPGAAARLGYDLKWALAGTLLIAAGAAWLKPLAWLGLALWLWPLLRLGRAWLACYRGELFRWHGAAPSLAAALAGFAAVLLFGSLHASGGLRATGVAHGFVAAFLFPLVTGAASQLLPVWLRPGQQTGWHHQLRQRLTRWSGVRALLFLCGGLILALGESRGWLAAAAGLVLFAAHVARAVIARETMLNGND